MTPYETRVEILSDFWMTYRDEEEFEDFFDYADLGLPLAWMIAANWVEPSQKAKDIIEETFMLLLNIVTGEDEDIGFENLEQFMGELDTE